MAPSSRGQGHRPLTAKTRVRIPVGSLLIKPVNPAVFSCQERERECRSHPRTRERLRKRVRPRSDARPKHNRKNQREDHTQGTEYEEAGYRCVTGDRRMGARFPDEGRGSDRGARKTHGEHRQEKDSGSPEEGQSAEERGKGREEYQGRHEALVPGGDPEITHPAPAPEQEDVPGHEGRCGELNAYIKSSPERARSLRRHENVERREDEERVQGISEKACCASVGSFGGHEE